MTEGLFVLTVIFVAYVFCVIVNDKKTQVKSTPPEAEAEKPTVSVVNTSPEPVLEKQPPKILKTETPVTVKKPAPSKQVASKKGLKNPATGEIANTHANYIFTKRWIKEALVSEGLLEKIYKNNEVTAEIEVAIKEAVAKLEAMDKYKA